MNVYIDMNKIANAILDSLIDKINILAPSFTVNEDQRKVILENIMNQLTDDSDSLEDLLEKLLIRNFEENAHTILASLAKLFGGINND